MGVRHGTKSEYDFPSVATKKCKRCKRVLNASEYKVSYIMERDSGVRVAYLRPYCNECQTLVHRENWIKNKERLTSDENLAKQRRERKQKFFQYRALSFRHHYKCKTEIKTKPLEEFLEKLWKKQKGLCAISGRGLTKENAQIDHIKPRKNGTDNSFDNLQWVTKDINRAKNQMTEKEFNKFIIDIYNHKKLELINLKEN